MRQRNPNTSPYYSFGAYTDVSPAATDSTRRTSCRKTIIVLEPEQTQGRTAALQTSEWKFNARETRGRCKMIISRWNTDKGCLRARSLIIDVQSCYKKLGVGPILLRFPTNRGRCQIRRLQNAPTLPSLLPCSEEKSSCSMIHRMQTVSGQSIEDWVKINHSTQHDSHH